MTDAPVLTREFVPEDLRDKPYLKDFLDKPFDKETAGALFKKLDGAETLIGKRGPAIPALDAKDEEWDKFFAPLRPAKADDYVLPGKEGAKTDEQFVKAVRESFFEAGIPKRQAERFMAKFTPQMEAYSAAKTKAQADAQAKADADFETLSKAALGDQNKAVMARINTTLKELCPAPMKAYLDKLSNENLVIMAAVIDAVQKKYMSEDELNPKGGGSGGDEGKSNRDKARELMASKAYTDAWHPEHDKTVAEVNALYAVKK